MGWTRRRAGTTTVWSCSLRGTRQRPALRLPVVVQLASHCSYAPVVDPGGTVVGILPDVPFVTRTIPRGPGDTLLLYTDGLTEARTDSDARFGANAFHTFLSQLPAGTATDLISRLTALLTTLRNGLDDDVALMALSIRAQPLVDGAVQASLVTSTVTPNCSAAAPE